MLKAYVNYPNPNITVHRELSCGSIQKNEKRDQRYIRVNISTISKELRSFANKDYNFDANRDSNDMWLEIDFGDPDFESSVLEHIRSLIGKHYTPFANITIDYHCG